MMGRNSRDMKITGPGHKEITPSTPLHSIQKTPIPIGKSQAEVTPAQEGISVEISDTSKEVGKIRAIVNAIPDIRVEFVSEIKESIDDGTYKRDSKVIAKKIVNEALFESVKNRER